MPLSTSIISVISAFIPSDHRTPPISSPPLCSSPLLPSASPLYSRLHSNNLQCDCHVAWLSDWLRQRPRLGLYTQCMSPPHLRGHNVAEVQKKEFVCTGRLASPLCCLLDFFSFLLFYTRKPFVSSPLVLTVFAHACQDAEEGKSLMLYIALH